MCFQLRTSKEECCILQNVSKESVIEFGDCHHIYTVIVNTLKCYRIFAQFTKVFLRVIIIP